MLFRKLQRKWKHNHSEACSEAVEGKWDPSHDPGMDLAAQEEPLDMEALEAFWRPLFKKQSLLDSRAPEATRDPNWNVVNPISTPEVKWAIKNSKRRTAPGLDCQKLSDIASIPQGELISLFNLWMHAGCCPSELCYPLLSSLFLKIMAKRLELYCPVLTRQNAFKMGDGIAENLFLLQATL